MMREAEVAESSETLIHRSAGRQLGILFLRMIRIMTIR
jgi:hypothetical protein